MEGFEKLTKIFATPRSQIDIVTQATHREIDRTLLVLDEETVSYLVLKIMRETGEASEEIIFDTLEKERTGRKQTGTVISNINTALTRTIIRIERENPRNGKFAQWKAESRAVRQVDSPTEAEKMVEVHNKAIIAFQQAEHKESMEAKLVFLLAHQYYGLDMKQICHLFGLIIEGYHCKTKELKDLIAKANNDLLKKHEIKLHLRNGVVILGSETRVYIPVEPIATTIDTRLEAVEREKRKVVTPRTLKNQEPQHSLQDAKVTRPQITSKEVEELIRKTITSATINVLDDLRTAVFQIIIKIRNPDGTTDATHLNMLQKALEAKGLNGTLNNKKLTYVKFIARILRNPQTNKIPANLTSQIANLSI